MKFRLPAMGLLLVAACASTQAHGQASWPNRPIRLLVPFAPGGAADALARQLTQRLSETMGAVFVVDNKPGAGGSLATTEAAKAPADGFTLLLGTNSTHAINPAIYSSLRYDVERDFAPITTVAISDYALAVPTQSPYRSVADIVAASRSQPVRYASSGNGTTSHLASALLASTSGTTMEHVPYKTNVQAIMDTIGGQVDFVIDNTATLVPQAHSGKMRLLATTGPERAAVTRDIPTLREAGAKGYEIIGWWALFAPAGTPETVLNRLNSEVTRVLSEPAFRERTAAGGNEPRPRSRQQTKTFVREELVKFRAVVKSANAQVD